DDHVRHPAGERPRPGDRRPAQRHLRPDGEGAFAAMGAADRDDRGRHGRHDPLSVRGPRAGPRRGAAVTRRAGRPSQDEAAALQVRILDAAAHEFLTHGYEHANMDAIAHAARTTKQTIYRL